MHRNRKTMRKRKGKLEREIEDSVFSEREKVSFTVFLKKIFSVGVNLFVLCCMVVQS